MKAHLKTKDGRITFEVEGGNQKELFEQIASVQEVFDIEQNCGCCESRAVRFQVREVDGHKFFEMVCNDCGARFQFGQTKQGNRLFPKSKAEDGSALPNHGWAKWQGRKNDTWAA